MDASDWSTYKLSETSDKAKCIVKLITTDTGIACQDTLMNQQLEKYMLEAQALGIENLNALMMGGNIRHLGGLSALKRIIAKTATPYTLENIYAALLTDTGSNQVGAPLFRSRHEFVFNHLNKYGIPSAPPVVSVGHEYNAAVVSKEATCAEPGVLTYTCKNCNCVKKEAIAMIAHTWTDATCTSPKKCTKCDATEGEANGHTDIAQDGTCDVCSKVIAQAPTEPPTTEAPEVVTTDKQPVTDPEPTTTVQPTTEAQPTTTKKEETTTTVQPTTEPQSSSTSKKEETTTKEQPTTEPQSSSTSKKEETTTTVQPTTEPQSSSTSKKEETTTKEQPTTEPQSSSTSKKEETTTKEQPTTEPQSSSTSKKEETTTKEQPTTEPQSSSTDKEESSSKEEVTTEPQSSSTDKEESSSKEEVTTEPQSSSTNKEESSSKEETTTEPQSSSTDKEESSSKEEVTTEQPTTELPSTSGKEEESSDEEESSVDEEETDETDVVKVKKAVIVKKPVSATYNCNEKAIALVVEAKATDGGTLTYQWYKNKRMSTSGATLIQDATTNRLIPDTSKAESCYYFCLVTNTNDKATGIKSAVCNSGYAKVQVKKFSNKITGVKSVIKKSVDSKTFKISAKANGNLKFKSSNTKVATVTSSGTVTVKSIGTAYITITAGNDVYQSVSKKIKVQVVPATVKLTYIGSSARKSLSVKWEKMSGISGFKIQYATTKEFKDLKTSYVGSLRHSKTRSDLKAGTKYYVRVCAYKKIGTTTYQGAYSSVKAFVVKK